MAIDFTGTGQGLSLTGTNFESKVDEFNRLFREATGMNSGSVGSDPTESVSYTHLRAHETV